MIRIGQEGPERASFTGRMGLAVMFPHTDDEAVHLVINLDKRRALGAAHGRRRMSGSAEARFELGCGVRLLFIGERAKGSFE